MTVIVDRALRLRGRHRSGILVVLAVTLGAVAMSGCGVVSAVRKVVHDVRTNKATINAFTSNMKASSTSSFEATYVTTGSSPTTVLYAVAPPKGLAFSDTPSAAGSDGIGRVNLIVNSGGEYSCAGSATTPTCERLQAASAATQNKIFSLYTPAYWVRFLSDFSLAAGFAGDTVSSSKLTVNGFKMQCVDFQAKGVPGTSTICTTAQGILGYVRVASDATSFEIKSYSASPSPSLFALPPGAKITTVQVPTT